LVAGFVSLFSIWVTKDLLSESNEQTSAVHALKDQDTGVTGAEPWNVESPHFNPHDYKDMGECMVWSLFLWAFTIIKLRLIKRVI
jgi:hypothetical protein